MVGLRTFSPVLPFTYVYRGEGTANTVAVENLAARQNGILTHTIGTYKYSKSIRSKEHVTWTW